uniref:Small ribosomal subunit protein bS16m n=1 Tax=Gasterosteus aculeatus aculeatus TaxID=481459 RepID=G3NA94_GASAC
MVHLSSLLLKNYHGGYVVIRLALAGHKQANRPFYRIVAAYNKRARDGKYIEQLGTYDPLPNIYNEKLVSFNFDRIKYWIGCGAHPTKPISKLLEIANEEFKKWVGRIFSSAPNDDNRGRASKSTNRADSSRTRR